MDEFLFENITLPRALVQSWFCNSNYSSEEVLAFLNLTCDDYLEENTFRSTEEVVSSGSHQHIRHITIAALLIFVAGIIFNVGLLGVLYSKKRFFKPSWYYVCNLVVADLLVLINMLGFIFYLKYPPSNWTRALRSFLFPSLDIFLSSASMLSVSAIALDRALTVISQQYRYSKYRSKLMKYVLAGLWMYCLLIFALAVCRIKFPVNKEYHMFVFWLANLVAFVGCVSITLVCYAVLSYLYLYHALVYKSSSSSQQAVDHLLCEKRRMNNDVQNRSTRVKQKYIWQAITISFSSLPFVLGWSFYLGVQTYEVLAETLLSGHTLNMAMLLVPWIVSAVNPLVYICSNKTIRKATLDCLCKCNTRWNNRQKTISSSSTSVEIL